MTIKCWEAYRDGVGCQQSLAASIRGGCLLILGESTDHKYSNNTLRSCPLYIFTEATDVVGFHGADQRNSIFPGLFNSNTCHEFGSKVPPTPISFYEGRTSCLLNYFGIGFRHDFACLHFPDVAWKMLDAV